MVPPGFHFLFVWRLVIFLDDTRMYSLVAMYRGAGNWAGVVNMYVCCTAPISFCFLSLIGQSRLLAATAHLLLLLTLE